MDDVFAMITMATGLSKDELLDGALNPEKQPGLLRKIAENAKPKDTFAEAVKEIRGGCDE